MNALRFFCFQYACDSGTAKFKDSRNKIVNKGCGKRSSSSGHNTCVPKSPWNLNSLYTLGRFVPGEKRVSHAINKFFFFCASWTLIAIFLWIKTYLSARKNHLQSLCNLPLRGWDIWGTTFGNISGAWWEHIGSKRKKQKKSLARPCDTCLLNN